MKRFIQHTVLLLALFGAAVYSQPASAADDEACIQKLGKTELINDVTTKAQFIAEALRLRDTGDVVSIDDLKAQLDRTECKLKLVKPSKKDRTPEEIYRNHKESVLLLGDIYKCEKCEKWHAGTATGFVLTKTGIIVTNEHVIGQAKNKETLIAMTAEGKGYAVGEVLASSEQHDYAILQLLVGGDKLKPLALKPDAPVGSSVTTISHPDGNYFVMTEGIVSRYLFLKSHGVERTWMAITADYAKGSSGGPIFDRYGNVAGIIARTRPVFYSKADGKGKNQQMVFHYCVPSRMILEAINSGK